MSKEGYEQMDTHLFNAASGTSHEDQRTFYFLQET